MKTSCHLGTMFFTMFTRYHTCKHKKKYHVQRLTCNQLSKRTPLSPPFVRSFFSRQNEKISGEQVITLKGMAKKDLLYEQGATSFVCVFLFCVELRWVESVMICGISGPVTRFWWGCANTPVTRAALGFWFAEMFLLCRAMKLLKVGSFFSKQNDKISGEQFERSPPNYGIYSLDILLREIKLGEQGSAVRPRKSRTSWNLKRLRSGAWTTLIVSLLETN